MPRYPNSSAFAPSVTSTASDRQQRIGSSTDEISAFGTDSPLFRSLRRSLENANDRVPSIALSLSPPYSRRASLGRELLDASDESLERHRIETNDYAVNEGPPFMAGLTRMRTTPERQGDHEARKVMSNRRSVDDSMVKDATAGSKMWSAKRDRRVTEQARFLGIFKGGKLEETISKIGDRVRRKEASSDSQPFSSPASRRHSEAVDSETDSAAVHHWLKNGHKRVSASVDGASLRQTTTNRSTPSKYHPENLPTFTSAFAASTTTQQSRLARDPLRPKGPPGAQPGHLHANHLPVSVRSSKASLSTPLDLSRTGTRNSEQLTADSRRNSDSLPVRSASPARSPRSVGREGGSRPDDFLRMGSRSVVLQRVPVTGLAQLDPSNQQRASSTGDRGHWNYAQYQTGAGSRESRLQKAMRVRAQVLSTGIRAQEIVQRYTTAAPLPAMGDPGPIQRWGSRSKQHVLAAQMASQQIEHRIQLARESIHQLDTAIVPAISQRIARLLDGLSSQLTPDVRARADEADAFMVELTTTSSLAVKEVHDALELLIRRRRRRVRWMRRALYLLLEWTLLALMWWVWLVVVAIRLVRGGLGLLIAGVRQRGVLVGASPRNGR
ncbi:MAG: hypothetical protein M1826_000011 [Phylliscum demangeonii]|nr:MAG: hypothetical protein M1826_000011 [Phylliscum demangeonii]